MIPDKKLLIRKVFSFPLLVALLLFLIAPQQHGRGIGEKNTDERTQTGNGAEKTVEEIGDESAPGSVEKVSREKPPRKNAWKKVLIITAVAVFAGAAAYFLIFKKEKTGSIDVQSTPSGAAIYLDGKETGKTTPALLEKIRTGAHTLTLKKAGFQDYPLSVTVAKDQTTQAKAELLAAAMTENFDDGKADNWTSNGYGTWQVINGKYTFKGSGNAGENAYAWYDLGDYTDFTYEAQIWNWGDQSIAFRGNPATGNWYVFYSWGNGKTWSFMKMGPGTQEFLIKEAYAAALKQYPERNVFRVVASGSNFTFYANGTRISAWTDTSFSRGKVGIWVRNKVGVTVEVDDVSVSLSTSTAAMNAAKDGMYKKK